MAEHLEAQRHLKRACGVTWCLLALFHYLCSISLWKSQKLESSHKSSSPFKNLWATFPKLQQSHLLRSEAALCIFHILQLQPEDGGNSFPSAKETPLPKLPSGSCDMKWQDFYENVFSVAEAPPLALLVTGALFVQLERSNDLFFQELIIDDKCAWLTRECWIAP